MHQNVPGVLSETNGIFAKNDVNVLAQHIRTNEFPGYAIADVDMKYNSLLYDDLRLVSHTSRVRVLAPASPGAI